MVNWKSFWESYRRKEIKNQDDLYFEVGKTANKQPLSEAAFQLSIDVIVRDLELSDADKLLELCCGNGLMTRRLASMVSEIRAVDFAEHLIASARKFASAGNVNYVCADVVRHLGDLVLSKSYIPSKILLGDALGYFEPQTLNGMLRAAITLTANKFVFIATGIPCDERKWDFYNTPEGVKRYEHNQLLPDNTNDGIGRWWRKEELERIGQELGLKVTVRDQPRVLSNFRMDAVFKSGE